MRDKQMRQEGKGWMQGLHGAAPVRAHNHHAAASAHNTRASTHLRLCQAARDRHQLLVEALGHVRHRQELLDGVDIKVAPAAVLEQPLRLPPRLLKAPLLRRALARRGGAAERRRRRRRAEDLGHALDVDAAVVELLFGVVACWG